MIKRNALSELQDLMLEFPAIALLGPRQVGKTTLARQLIGKLKKEPIYFDLEADADLQRLKDPAFLFEQYAGNCIILDEVQRMPSLFRQLRPVIDKKRTPGKFILTGSASPDLVKGVSESLAGRIAFLELTPITLPEARRARISQVKHWYRGGFPDALLAANDAAYIRWASNFIRSYIERDLSILFGVNLSEKIIRNFWYMLAANNGGIWNAETYARSLGVSSPTIKRYLDFLEGAFLIRQLPTWFVNTQKRLVKAPKVYIRDSGILHVLNGVLYANQLPLNITVGASWEGYVVEQVASLKPPHLEIYYYRTHHGAECDIILTKGTKPILAAEIKFSNNPVMSKGFYTSLEDLDLKHGYVIVPKGNTYQVDKKLTCLNLVNFLTEILPSL